MAIKMRTTRNEDAICCSCGCDKEHALDVFDVMVGKTILHLCDDCMEKLSTKTLNAVCYTNGRIKSPKDIRIRNERMRGKYNAKKGS